MAGEIDNVGRWASAEFLRDTRAVSTFPWNIQRADTGAASVLRSRPSSISPAFPAVAAGRNVKRNPSPGGSGHTWHVKVRGNALMMSSHIMSADRSSENAVEAKPAHHPVFCS